MVDKTTVTLVANGDGAQPFFNGKFLTDSSCPLRQGEECTAQAIPGVGVLLTPVRDTREFRITTIGEEGDRFSRELVE